MKYSWLMILQFSEVYMDEFSMILYKKFLRKPT